MDKKYITDQLNNNFSIIQFKEKEHEYMVKGKVLTPTSNKVGDYYRKFPVEQASKNYAKKHGLKQKDVIAMWNKKRDDACDLGTEVHYFGEQYMLRNKNYPIKDDDPLRKRKEQVIKFWDNLPDHYSCIAIEQRMFNEKYDYAGTTDFLLFDERNSSIVVGDYKTNGDLFKTYGNFMEPPFEYLEDMPFNHYQLQLSLYQILLEEIGLPVSNRVVVWLKEDEYKLFFPVDFTGELRKAIA